LTIGRRFSTCPTSSAEFLDIRMSETRLSLDAAGQGDTH
jgi:hypothetical protein